MYKLKNWQLFCQPFCHKRSFLVTKWWQERQGSNPRPSVLETDALPTELRSCEGKTRHELYQIATSLLAESGEKGRTGLGFGTIFLVSEFMNL